MDASEDGRHTASGQWTAPQPIVPLPVFAARHVRRTQGAGPHRRTHPRNLRTTKVLPQNGPVHIDPARGTRDSLPVFPGESTS
ncbi:hypothetical protein C9412_08360 [Stenotrophomonas sp. Nf1]|nr:hypothetical protein C9412_08360 [Stenotrophomonas sp. Nf1]PTA78065.1 hypothetical protein C9416_13995 [Stenotrophomonas sp. Nf4]